MAADDCFNLQVDSGHFKSGPQPASRPPTRPFVRSESGVAVLGVTVVLLLVLSLMGLYANRAVWLEQKTTGNQYRAKQAMEAAEAGLEYMLAVLQVKTSGTGAFELTDYLTRDSSGRYSISNAGPVVGSPGTGQAFSVTISLIPGDAGTQRRFVLTSTGGSDCSPTIVDLTTCQSRARASVKLRFINLVANPPDSSLSSRLTVKLGGNVTVTNDTGTGKAIDSGGQVLLSGSASGKVGATTSGAACGSNSTTSCNNPALAQPSGDQFFASIFGADKATVKAGADTVLPAGSQPADGVTNQLIWIDGTTSWSGNNTYGTASQPVIIIVNGNLTANGSITVNGLLYVIGKPCDDSSVCSTATGSTDTVWANSGGGNFSVNGLAISEGALTGTGTPTVTKITAIISALSANLYSVSKLMGSWKDW